MDMEDQYGIGDLRQYMNGRPIFTAIPPPPLPPPPPPDLFLSSSSSHHGHHHMTQQQAHYHDLVMGSGLMFRGGTSDPSSNNNAGGGCSNSASASLSGGGGGGFEMEVGGGGGIGGGDGGGNGRWPRQETLSLLEVRSRLDSKFKEANQKGPLWDEVSRIMCEEHGYQRSGKKCREKFENLYKYYKKTKEGKAGRQDGKHYRFFRQLEALYGETSNNPSSLVSENVHLVGTSFQTPYRPYHEEYQAPSRLCDSLSLSNNSSGFDTSSSEYSDLNVATASLMEPNDSYDKMKKRKGRRNWKAKIKEFIDAQMRKLMEKQEEWLEKMMKTIEHKEQERISREEEWRRQEVARVDREQKFWANERAWIEARDAAFMEALNKLSGKELIKASNYSPQCENQSSEENFLSSWQETEITRLIQLRTSMEPKFEQSGGMEEVLWDEIAEKMARLGYHRSGLMCKAKWDSINDYLMKSKKPKESSRSSSLYTNQNNEAVTSHQGGVTYREAIERVAPNHDHQQQHGPSPANTMPDSCFRFFMGDTAENMWDTYGVKITKGDNQ